MKSIYFLVAASAMAFPLLAVSQVSTCAAVYADSVRNIDIRTRVLVEQSDIYNNYCESNGKVKNSKTGVDLQVPLKVITLKVGISHEEQLQQMQQFCKTQSDNLSRSESTYQYSNSVVVDSLRSYNQCLQFERNSVNVSHVTTESRSLAVRVDFNPATSNVVLQSVQYDPRAATCTSNILGTGAKTIDASTGEVKATQPFSVTCDRKTESSAGGEKFRRLELLMVTNQGSYTVAMPLEEMYGYDLASQSKKKVEAVTIENVALTKEAAILKTKLSSPKARLFNVLVGEGGAIGCGGNPATYANGTCKAGEYRTPFSVTPDRSGGHCGYRNYSWACVSYPE